MTKMPSYLATAAALLTLSFATSAIGETPLAEVTTKISTSAPTDQVIASYAPLEISGQYAWKGGSAASELRNVGQTFTVATPSRLTKITLMVGWVGNSTQGAPFTMNLNTYDDASNPTPRSTVWTYSGVLPGALAAEWANNKAASKATYLTFEVPETALIPGKVYGVALYFEGEASQGRGIAFNIRYGHTYKGGIQLCDESGSTAQNPASSTWVAGKNDFHFWIQGIPLKESDAK